MPVGLDPSGPPGAFSLALLTVGESVPQPTLDQLGPYRLTHTLGAGGMGVVYEAIDERLGRRVALKVIHDQFLDAPGARVRFEREARLAAGVNHPNVCQVFDFGATDGRLFLAMERLDGESLADRLRSGPLPLRLSVETALGLLAALEAIHAQGIVHRDLKPSNVFLTPHGVKLLDFGLARTIAAVDETRLSLTQSGAILGTPRYMAPEQVRSAAIDERTDIFSAGVILYEMLAGGSPFDAPSAPAAMDRVLRDEPPMLGGSPAVMAVDRVIHRSLAKNPSHRYPSAAAMASELRAVAMAHPEDEPRRATPITRVIVLPFRLLKPDTEVEFLSFGLADAIATSLSSIETLVVRSSLVGARYSAAVPDLQTIATEASVDVVVTGTLLTAGKQLRAAAQLVDAVSGHVIWSSTSQVAVGDVFQLQDELSRRIVESLARPLSGREEKALSHDVPSSARAYEFYLRANEVSREPGSVDVARDLYLQCVQADPNYAPAWARLGHLYRVMGKYRNDRETVARAESALLRALELNPHLSFADRVFAQIEVDYGRARDAMVRLVRRAVVKGNDADLFAGLVHSCRYCGLFDASVTAHTRAIRIDPNVRTSLQYTLMMAGDYDRAVAEAGGYDSVAGMTLTMAGHPDAARECRKQAAQFVAAQMPPFAKFCEGVAALAEGRVTPLRQAVDDLVAGGLRDPEALFIHGLLLTGGGDHTRGLELMRDAVERGYLPYTTLTGHRWLDPLRGDPAFSAIVRKAELEHKRSLAAFLESGGGDLERSPTVH